MALQPGVIPISDAADICKKRGCAYVIVFGVREDGQKFHVTTYGKTKALCKLAGAIGDQIAQAVLDGRVEPPETEPEDTCREAVDRILTIQPESYRGELGRVVRAAWVEWAKQQPNPPADWLAPWEDMPEPHREVDRRIGEAVADFLRVKFFVNGGQ